MGFDENPWMKILARFFASCLMVLLAASGCSSSSSNYGTYTTGGNAVPAKVGSNYGKASHNGSDHTGCTFCLFKKHYGSS